MASLVGWWAATTEVDEEAEEECPSYLFIFPTILSGIRPIGGIVSVDDQITTRCTGIICKTHPTTTTTTTATTATTTTQSHDTNQTRRPTRRRARRPMAAPRHAFSAGLKELRFLFCQTSEPSAAVRSLSPPRSSLLPSIPLTSLDKSPEAQANTRGRKFLTNSYPVMKKHNPHTPILIREAAGIEPRVFARFGKSIPTHKHHD